jgi:hypothetical protein
MGLFKIRDGQAQVAFGGGKGAVAEQILDMAQMGLVLAAVSDARVTPHVWCGVLLHLRDVIDREAVTPKVRLGWRLGSGIQKRSPEMGARLHPYR